MTEALTTITEEEARSASPRVSTKHPNGFPKNIERMFETFHQTPTGEFKPTFYNPFEIKHRRRTSRDQFAILEASFQENSKPNATVRRALEGRLGMTPRAVQVWFQNRRAKMKTGGGVSPVPSTNVPQSPIIPGTTSTEASTACSSLASPDHTSMMMRKPSLNQPGKKAMPRRHSMPNMAPVNPNIITNNHFKQLHEAIFGGNQASSLNYQIPLKQSSANYENPNGYPGYYMAPVALNGFNSPQIHKTRSATLPQYMDPVLDDAASTMGNDLDFFLQSIIIPQNGSQAPFSLDNHQIPGLTENLASFLCGPANSDVSTHPQPSDSFLLSKYMNDERFAD